jgi:choline dehydrogenase-like flavoprotein
MAISEIWLKVLNLQAGRRPALPRFQGPWRTGKPIGSFTVERGPTGIMGPSTHAYGGTRMGDNRETNVVNRFGFSREVPNLGILGASVMGTSGAHNPTRTAQALA